MSPDAERLTEAYRQVRLRKKNEALKGVVEDFRNVDINDIKQDAGHNWAPEAVGAVYVARLEDEFLTQTYHSMMELIETGQAHEDFKVDNEFLRWIGWIEDDDN